MKKHPLTLREVRARLDFAVSQLPDVSPEDDPQAVYDRYEDMAISTLDSEFDSYRENELETYLETLLYQCRLELGLVEFPLTNEES